MIKLSQRDIRWGWKPIGNTKYLVRDWGCTLTCVSMASDYFGCYQDPAWCAKNLTYTADAKILWQSIEQKLCFKFKWRFYKHDKFMILDGIQDPNKVCLLNVYGRHWVLATRKVPFGYWVVDPWTGTNKYYGEGAVTGGTILIK